MRSIFIALVAIVVLGAGVRLFHLSSVPTELIVDEISPYNSMRSIVTTGRDVDGLLLPFFHGDFLRYPPLYGVSEYASSLLLGKTPFGLRFPAVVFGVAAILLVYVIALELTRRRDIALVAALLQATQPIFIHFSRIAWEPASELPFLLGGVYLLLRTLRPISEPTQPRRTVSFAGLAAAAVLLGLASYTYMAGWGYAVMLAGSLAALCALRAKSWQLGAQLVGAFAIWLLVSSAALWMWLYDPLTTWKTQRLLTFENGVGLGTLLSVASNYAAYFHWSYLVTTGDPVPGTTWRYLNGFGAFYSWVVVFAAIGLLATFRYVRAGILRAWVWLWLIFYPVGGALTIGEIGPNAPRTLAGAPVFCILAAVGFVLLLDAARWLGSRGPRWRFAPNAVWATLVAGTMASLAYFSWFYFTQYVHQNSIAWDSGTAAMFATVRTDLPRYDRVCFSVHPTWYEIDAYIRFYLAGVQQQTIQDVHEPACYLPRTLMVTDTDDVVTRPGFVPIDRIVDVDGNGFALIQGRLK